MRLKYLWLCAGLAAAACAPANRDDGERGAASRQSLRTAAAARSDRGGGGAVRRAPEASGVAGAAQKFRNLPALRRFKSAPSAPTADKHHRAETPDVFAGDPKNPLHIAEHLCAMSIGSFPNWAMYPSYREFLAPDEEDAVAALLRFFESDYVGVYKSRFRAISRFYARHARCARVAADGEIAPPGGHPDNAGNLHFVFDQELPKVPNLPDYPSVSGGYDAFADAGNADRSVPKIDASPRAGIDIDQNWLTEIETAWDGSFRSGRVRIILKPDGFGSYILNSDIRRSYLEPLEIQRIGMALSPQNIDVAARLLADSCRRRTIACKTVGPYVKAAQDSIAEAKSVWNASVKFGASARTSIQFNAGRQDTRVTVDLVNASGMRFKNIWLRTAESSPRYCELQNTFDNSENSANTAQNDVARFFVLEPHARAKAVCIIGNALRPDIAVEFVYADAAPPDDAAVSDADAQAHSENSGAETL